MAVTSNTGNNEAKKLDWMYKDASQIVDREEYLLGRKIDKQFEASLAPPNKDQECLPPSIFSGFAMESQVDVARKLQEDPLYLIKKKEIENREQLLKNPRKLKQLQEMVARQQAAAEKLKRKQLKKKKKKEIDALLANKCKKLFGTLDAKKLAALENSSSSNGEVEVEASREKKRKTKDLDKLIAIKYKKMLGNLDAEQLLKINSSSDSESYSEKDRRRIKKSSSSNRSYSRTSEGNKIKGSKKSHKSSSSDDERRLSSKTKVRKKEQYSKEKERSIKDQRESKEKYIYETKDKEEKKNQSSYFESGSDSSHKNYLRKKSRPKTKQNYSSEERVGDLHHKKSSKKIIIDKKKLLKRDRHKISSCSSSSESSDEDKYCKGTDNKLSRKSNDYSKKDKFYNTSSRTRKDTEDFQSKSKNKKTSSLSSDSSSSEKESKAKKLFGLVLPANYVPKPKIKEETKPMPVKEIIKKSQKNDEKKKMTQEEKELKLKEMMDNAKWREDLRDKNIKSYKEKQNSEKDDYVYKEDFLRNQMAYAMSQGTVESRVKANINTIQRNVGAMDEHFARRK